MAAEGGLGQSLCFGRSIIQSPQKVDRTPWLFLCKRSENGGKSASVQKQISQGCAGQSERALAACKQGIEIPKFDAIDPCERRIPRPAQEPCDIDENGRGIWNRRI